MKTFDPALASNVAARTIYRLIYSSQRIRSVSVAGVTGGMPGKIDCDPQWPDLHSEPSQNRIDAAVDSLEVLIIGKIAESFSRSRSWHAVETDGLEHFDLLLQNEDERQFIQDCMSWLQVDKPDMDPQEVWSDTWSELVNWVHAAWDDIDSLASYLIEDGCIGGTNLYMWWGVEFAA